MNRTLGISPKLTAAVAAAVVSYLLTQTVLELPALVVLVCQAFLVGLAAYVAKPGALAGEPTKRSDHVDLRDPS